MHSTKASYDYIVVGAGTAGCVLASRLTEDENIRVLLLEAGPRQTAATDARPSEWPALLASDAVYADTTVLQQATGTSLFMPHGRGLGGSSAVNAMDFVRGTPASYDAWAEAGAEGWAYDDILPFLKRSERTHGRDAAVRGTDGPVVVSPLPEADRSALLVACLEAGAEAGHPTIADPSAGLEEGLGWFDVTIVDGKRQSVTDAYLTPAPERPNLTVVTDALVRRVRVSDGRCTGVDYAVHGEPVSVDCAREVVLTAGTIGTAHLLLVSGIGPAGHLGEVGVDLVHDLPGVGANLHDHPACGVTYSASRPVETSPQSNLVGAGGLMRSDPSVTDSDLHLALCEAPFYPAGAQGPDNGYTLFLGLLTPYSRGTLRLTDADVRTRPLLDPNYFADPRDVAAMVSGIRQCREIGQAPALEPWRDREVEPGPDVADDDAVADYLRATISTYFHPVGTCRIGTDDMAVVDPRLRVRGIDGLRIADASVMPSIVTANTNATVIAIAERAATLIRADSAGTVS